MNDLKFAFRQLLKNPGFTAVAVLTLALGIGATTALFSVIYAVLISPYPYANPDGIWSPGLQSAGGSEPMRPYRLGEFKEMAKLSVFADTMGTWPETAVLAGEFAPELVRGVRVTGNAFQFLGVRPVLETNDRVVGPRLRRGRLPAPRSSHHAHGVSAIAWSIDRRRSEGRCSPAMAR